MDSIQYANSLGTHFIFDYILLAFLSITHAWILVREKVHVYFWMN